MTWSKTTPMGACSWYWEMVTTSILARVEAGRLLLIHVNMEFATVSVLICQKKVR